MRNNIQNDVKVEKATLKTSKFNVSRSIASTASIGRVNVGFSQFMVPNSKAFVSQEQLVRMAPLVAPTYAKQKYKTWHTFVPFADVFPNFDSMLAEQAISRGGTLIQPTKVPHMKVRDLTAWVLNGAKCTIYQSKEDTTDLASAVTFGAGNTSPSSNSVYKTRNNSLLSYLNFVSAAGMSVPSRINIGKLLNLTDPDITMYSGNFDTKSFGYFDISDENYPQYYKYTNGGYDTDMVTLESADLTYRTSYDKAEFSGWDKSCVVIYAFRLSSWGMALANTLRGLGYPLDLGSSEDVSLLPLFACYKAYWDIFGLGLWQNFEQTNCGKLISISSLVPDMDIFVMGNTPYGAFNAWKSFIYDELGAMWLTEQNDYVSAHLPQPTISKPADVGQFVDVTNSGNTIVQTDTSSQSLAQPGFVADGHAHTSVVQHGYLDSELLKRLYKSTNRNTALGRKIADLMRAQGLGTYMERTRVNYIGDTSLDIDVSSVTSQSDTFDEANNSGKLLGAYGGKGVGWKQHDKKKLFYKTDCFGIWICLNSVTCDAGYSQGADLLTSCVMPKDFYHPDFDGLGLELHPFSLISGQVDHGDDPAKRDPSTNHVAPPSMITFGYGTRYSSWKVGRNLINGGFAQRSVRKNFVPYNMDKLLYINEVDSVPVDKGTSLVDSIFGDVTHLDLEHVGFQLPCRDAPTAGNSWRFLARFPWLQNLNRIFANVGMSLGSENYGTGIFAFLASTFEYRYRTDDNYITFEDVVMKYWAPMLPIEETYGTIDPDAKQLEYIDRV